MRRQHLPFYAIATAIVTVGLVAFGLPVSSSFLLVFVLVCPLMMLFMMRGMHGGSGQGGSDRPGRPTEDRDHSFRLGRQ